jgi:hypothetical protein
MAKEKGQKMIYKTLHSKLKIEQLDPHLKLGANPCALGLLTVTTPLVTAIVLLLNDTNIIWLCCSLRYWKRPSLS